MTVSIRDCDIIIRRQQRSLTHVPPGAGDILAFSAAQTLIFKFGDSEIIHFLKVNPAGRDQGEGGGW